MYHGDSQCCQKTNKATNLPTHLHSNGVGENDGDGVVAGYDAGVGDDDDDDGVANDANGGEPSRVRETRI